MDIRNYIIAKVWFHVLANPRMKNAECLNLLPNLTLHIALVYIYLKLIAVAKGRNKHVTDNVKFVRRYGSRAAAEATI